MVRHVALQGSDRNKPMIDCVVISAGGGAIVEVFFTDPEIWLPAGIDMFADNRTSIFDSLPCDANPSYLLSRNIDVQQTPFRESFRQDLPHCDHGELRSFAKVESFTRNQTKGQTRNAENRGFEGTGNSAGIGSIVTEIATVIDS